MKKLLLFGFALSAFAASAALPAPHVSVLPSQNDWFDAFSVVWAEKLTEPYQIEIVNPSGIEVTKNMVEDIRILAVQTTEYQEDEYTQNYPDAQLVVTLAGIEMEVGSTYSLLIPAGAVNIILPDGTIEPNDVVNYSFTLNSGNAFTLPEPDVEPAEGDVYSIETIEMTWAATLGGNDLLNLNVVLGYDSYGNPYVASEPDPVTASFNGEELENIEVAFEWSSREAVTDGADGDIMVIDLGEELSGMGTLEVVIPKDFLRISDIEKGTYYNSQITLTYEIIKESGVSNIQAVSAQDGKIYGVNGMEVKDKDNLNGLYIINGQKVLIKR